MRDASDNPFRRARNAVNAGAGIDEFLRHAAPGNTSRANNQRYDLHVLSPDPSKKGLRRGRGLEGPELAQPMFTITFISWPLGLSSERNPFSTMASGSMRPVTIFSTGSLPLEIIRITRGHIVTS